MKIKKNLKFISTVILISGAIISPAAWGVDSSYSIGSVAGNIFGIGMTISGIIKIICIVTGCGLILGSLVQYKKHRENPVETTWGTVLFTFLAGVAIICLSFIPISV